MSKIVRCYVSHTTVLKGIGKSKMKCLRSIVENFAFDIYFEEGTEDDFEEKALFLVFENDGLDVFPTVFLSRIDEKTALLDSFLNGDTDETTLKLGFDETPTPPYIDYINTVTMNFRRVEERFVKLSIDLSMYDFEYKYLCQSGYNIGLDSLSVEDLTISRNYTYLTTISEIEKFNDYLKSYKKTIHEL